MTWDGMMGMVKEEQYVHEGVGEGAGGSGGGVVRCVCGQSLDYGEMIQVRPRKGRKGA